MSSVTSNVPWFWRRIRIEADRWPWQGKRTFGRFGGGWEYELGFQCSKPTRRYGWTLIVTLLFGLIVFRFQSRADWLAEERRRAASN